ncbi:MAG TPA: hypothetical protein ACQGQW_08315, partial [Xylella fastidiosa subsp. pauca]
GRQSGEAVPAAVLSAGRGSGGSGQTQAACGLYRVGMRWVCFMGGAGVPGVAPGAGEASSETGVVVWDCSRCCLGNGGV